MSFKIQKVTAKDGYEQLRSLWCRVFGDAPDYVDSVYRLFGEDIRGYAVTDASGRVVSALSCYLCGSYEGRPAYVSYAVCTDEAFRGQGLAGMLVGHVRDEVLSEGGISVVSPAEPSLVGFYAAHGYEEFFSASRRTALNPELDAGEFDDYDEYDIDMGTPAAAAAPDIELKAVSADVYNRYREAYLSGRPHIGLSAPMLRLAESESMDGKGFFAVNGGDAVCALREADPGAVVITELIVNPVLLGISSEIEAEIAGLIAKKFGAAEAVYSVPGRGFCQSMAAGISGRSGRAGNDFEDAENGSADPEEYSEEYLFEEAYYGFPID